MSHRLICSTIALLLISGCSSRVSHVESEMSRIQQEPPLPLQAAPVFDKVPNFEYAAQGLRNPFLQTSLYTELKVRAGKKVSPNLAHVAQPLEAYPLESLLMRGMLQDGGKTFALIQAPDKQVYRVSIGSYMGLNQGRIVSLTPERIQLIEIVSDGQNGYLERPRTLVLVGQNA
ncbi:pilus assembly protein PilP [Acinetobacter baretiae]|uniref:pilus assembly protein PilP n=1 Tax=Acinetobacter baretiae TaxID=2605383 RepID=UPI0038B3A33C